MINFNLRLYEPVYFDIHLNSNYFTRNQLLCDTYIILCWKIFDKFKEPRRASKKNRSRSRIPPETGQNGTPTIACKGH